MDRREELIALLSEWVYSDKYMGNIKVQRCADAILSWLSEHYVDKPKYDEGIIKGPFKDCDCESHHQHGINGPQGCVVCNPPVEHYEEKK